MFRLGKEDDKVLNVLLQEQIVYVFGVGTWRARCMLRIFDRDGGKCGRVASNRKVVGR